MKLLKTHLFFIVFLCCILGAYTDSFAQGVQVKGKIIDNNNEAIIGANVIVKGTAKGGISDVEGHFSLEAPHNSVLVVSFIGYQAQEVKVVGAYLEIKLGEDAELLDEVVVIGYGVAKRKDFTGSVSSVRLEDSPIALISNMNPLEALKGSVTGLDIGATTSAGGAPSMLIRGQNSISGSNTPLLVVDGVVFLGDLSDINPNDIASFDVLKDATSAAAYGSRSANGVVAITTKKGKSEKPVIRLNTTGTMQLWHLRPELMNGEQWVDAVSARNRYSDLSFMSVQERQNFEIGKEVDWLDVSNRTGWIQDYSASVSGAGNMMNYYVSAAYTNNSGVVVGDDYKRISILGKISTDITKWLKVGVDAAYTRSDYSGVAANLSDGLILSPYSVMYRNEEQKLIEKFPNGQNSNLNPLWGVDSDVKDNADIRNDLRVNTYAEIRCPFLDGLSYRLNYSATRDNREDSYFDHEGSHVQQGAYNDESRYSESTIKNFLAKAGGKQSEWDVSSWVVDNILNYNNAFGKHTIDITAVATRDSRIEKYSEMSGSDFADNGNSILGVKGLAYAKVQKVKSEGNKRNNIGYLGRASYSYDETYYLTASYRRDGSSVFGANSKWGNFGAAGLAWRLTNETFMKNVKQLNNMKLKLSWGRNGNQGVGPYSTLSSVSTGPVGGIYYPFNNLGKASYGIIQSVLGNTNLNWETTEAWNMGFESSWFNNRVFIDLDVYLSKTYDQVFNRSIPVMTGFSSIYSSMGEVSNKGVDLTIRTVNIQNKDWTWTSGVTFWLNRNKLVHLYGEDLNNDGIEDDDIGNNLFIGKSIHSIYGLKQDGIVQIDDREYMEKNGVEVGTPKYVDTDGNGAITVDDRSIIGSSDPNFKLNLSNTLNYKNWNFYLMLSGTFSGNGYYQQSNKQAYMVCGGSNNFAANSIYVPYWTEENRSNKYPKATFTGDNYYLGLQNRTYIRLQDVALSYTFQEPWVKKAGIAALKLFVTGKNLFTITNWKGGDPEIGSTVQSGSYPTMTTFSVGANLNF